MLALYLERYRGVGSDVRNISLDTERARFDQRVYYMARANNRGLIESHRRTYLRTKSSMRAMHSHILSI